MSRRKKTKWLNEALEVVGRINAELATSGIEMEEVTDEYELRLAFAEKLFRSRSHGEPARIEVSIVSDGGLPGTGNLHYRLCYDYKVDMPSGRCGDVVVELEHALQMMVDSKFRMSMTMDVDLAAAPEQAPRIALNLFAALVYYCLTRREYVLDEGKALSERIRSFVRELPSSAPIA